MNAESGGKNVLNSSGASTASGYFQITNPTWASTAAGQASGVTRAIDAPYATQQAAAAELIQRNGLNDWAPYDSIKDGNANDYDKTLLSGPNGSTASGSTSGTFSPGSASGADSADGGATGAATGTQTGNAWSSGAASGADSADAGLNPATTPIAITTSQKAADLTADQNTTATNKTATANTATAGNTLVNFYNGAHAALGDLLFRVVLVAVGCVLLAGALWIIASEEGGATASAGQTVAFTRRKIRQVARMLPEAA